jgi:hypothetical protein
MMTHTTKLAAKSIRGFQTSQENKVVSVVQSTVGDGLTREEISDHAEISLASTCGRANELLRRGVLLLKLVPGTDELEMRKTRSGRWAEILVTNPLSPELAK